jgi:flagellin-like protein
MLKGVSPVIAVVLLIALVSGLAGIIYAWSRGMVVLTTERVRKEMEVRAECLYASIDLFGLRYCEPWFIGFIQNTGAAKLNEFRFQVIFKNLSLKFVPLCFAENRVLSCAEANASARPGEIFPFNLSLEPNYDLIKLLTDCPDVSKEVSYAEIPLC